MTDLPVLTANGSSFDVAAACKKALINLKKKVPKPPICLAIRQGSEEIGICSMGDFSIAVGKAKSRKTSLVSLMTAALISNDYVCDTFRGLLPEDQRTVLYVDTEQSEYDAINVTSRATRLAGDGEFSNFIPAMLREYKTEHRKAMLEWYMQNIPNIGFVVIDGIRDLVKSVNNEDECIDMVDWIMTLSSKYRCHILCVIHENKVGGQVRGHLGTELQNKAQTIIGIAKPEDDENISIVKVRESRHKPFKPFAIGFDEEAHLPTVNLDYEVNEKSKSYKKTPKKKLKDYEPSDHCRYLGQIFSYSIRMPWRDLIANIKTEYPDILAKEAEKAAKWLVENDFLEKEEDEKDSTKIFYTLSEKTKMANSPL